MSRPIEKIVELYKNSFQDLSRDVWLLALLMLINRCGTMVILFMTIYLTEELSWSKLDAGLAMSVFGLGSATGAFIGGWLTDRIGYYTTMFWSLILGGLSFLALMQVTSFYPYLITVYIVSTLNDIFRPANLASVSAYSKPEHQNRSLSLIRLAINLGFGIGVGGAGLISEYFGFKYLFIIDAVTCVSAAIYLRFALEDKPEQAEKALKDIPKKPEESAYRDYPYLVFAFMVLLLGIVFAQLWNTIPIYYTDILSLTKDQYGYIMVVNGILIFIFEMPIVYLLETRYNKMSLVLVGALMITFGFLIYNICAFWQLALTIAILAVTFGEIISFPFSNAFALSRSKPGRRGEYMGIYSMAWSIATIVAPTMGMYIAQTYSFTVLWYVISGIGAVACIGFYILKKKGLGKLEVVEKEEAVFVE